MSASVLQSSMQCSAGNRLLQPTRPQRLSRHVCVARASASADSQPALKKPEAGGLAAKPTANAPSQPRKEASAAETSSSSVTIEYQRRQAKEMLSYFRSLKFQEEVQKAKVFGWTKKNEITNGRWVMFGLAVGLLTEYATGVDFIDQLKLMSSYLGIADIYD
ncbi:hypothetical protein WJX72_001049 [[Myrmecia] bisecta]|uniref:Uncharacterized protein n=1 Tax=[Myrmecia] bisecta TaxID=41462 RepID=A0AAW1Q3C3_9CHLO